MTFSPWFVSLVSLVSVTACTAALSLSTVACQKVDQVLDANNSQPGAADGRAVQLTTINQRIARMSADGTQIVAVAESGDVFVRPLDGTALFAPIGHFDGVSFANANCAMVIDSATLYVVSLTGLYRMPRAGGSGERLDVDTLGEGIAQSADAVFVASGDGGSILRVDKATRAVTVLATDFERVGDVIADGDRLDVADRNGNTIWAVPMAGGAKVVLAANQATPYALGLGPEHLYWANGLLSDDASITDRLMRIRRDGTGTIEPLASCEQVGCTPIIADDAFVYLGSLGSGLFRAPVDGGDATKFVNMGLVDFFLDSSKAVVALENNGLKFSDAEKNKPNRLLRIAE